jgi:hypothetical protein
MPARQIPQYTDRQLDREIARLSNERVDTTLDTDDFLAAVGYRSELLEESFRRMTIRDAQQAVSA